MESYYASKLPTIGALYMTHFRKDDPYFIERDLVTPPLQLQRLIFPWIEDTFVNDEELSWKTPSCIEECDKEMLGADPDVSTESDTHFVPAEQTISSKNLSTKLVNSALVDRIGFLKLLVRLRRVILQDAVLYLKPNANGQTLSNELLESCREKIKDIYWGSSTTNGMKWRVMLFGRDEGGMKARDEMQEWELELEMMQCKQSNAEIRSEPTRKARSSNTLEPGPRIRRVGRNTKKRKRQGKSMGRRWISCAETHNFQKEKT